MRTFICEICGDAYLGEEKPKNCPFCGARENFIKNGNEANPYINIKPRVSEVSKKNLQTTLDLEIKANALYLCMAGKAKSYEVKAMYKRIAKVEMEHASICAKLLGISMPGFTGESCSDKEVENFKETMKLEKEATDLYFAFAKEAEEMEIKTVFTALAQAEGDHLELIRKYLE